MTSPDAPLGVSVYDQLRRQIVRGDLRPNELLSEIELAERLQVSRTPVRESLTRLAAEGLIRSQRRRWIVHEHTLDEIRDVYEVRAALEGQAASLAAQRADDGQIARLFDYLEQARSIEEDPTSSTELVTVNDEFHAQVLAMAGNRALTGSIDAVTQYNFNYRIAILYSVADRAEAAAQHRRIATAIRDRDASEARQRGADHVLAGLDRIERLIGVPGAR